MFSAHQYPSLPTSKTTITQIYIIQQQRTKQTTHGPAKVGTQSMQCMLSAVQKLCIGPLMGLYSTLPEGVG